ncbi:hypothetical protein PM082_017600 [Marasmius tenuissimus]|nr:hypothetical protein PM082_017600 [Marasmius tenuissimus]
MSCRRCGSSENNPQRFLLTCQVCKTSWHHRCHVPLLSDLELRELVRASTLRSTNSSVGTRRTVDTWRCAQCEARDWKDKVVSGHTPSNERSSRQENPEEVEVLEISSSEDEVPLPQRPPPHRRFGGNARMTVPSGAGREHREVVEISSDSEDSAIELLPRPPRLVTKPSSTRRRIPAVAPIPRPRTPDSFNTQEVDRLEHLIQQIKAVGNGSNIARRQEPCRRPDSAPYSLAPAWMQSILADGTSNKDEHARTGIKVPRKRVAKRLDHEHVVLDLVNIP